jgi:hypothetical protein
VLPRAENGLKPREIQMNALVLIVIVVLVLALGTVAMLAMVIVGKRRCAAAGTVAAADGR